MRKGFYLILILLFPSIIFLIFSLGEHHVTKMGSYGSYQVQDNGDTIYKPVPDLVFVDHDGHELSMEDLRGKPVLFDFYTVPCDEACRKKGVTLVNYLNDVAEKEKWMVLSVCVDSVVSQADLKQLKNDHLPEMQSWKFVSAKNQKELEAFLQYAFVNTQRLESLSQIPSKDFMLIDQQGIIREYFDSRIHKENKKLQDAIKLLVKEPFMTWKEVKK